MQRFGIQDDSLSKRLETGRLHPITILMKYRQASRLSTIANQPILVCECCLWLLLFVFSLPFFLSLEGFFGGGDVALRKLPTLLSYQLFFLIILNTQFSASLHFMQTVIIDDVISIIYHVIMTLPDNDSWCQLRPQIIWSYFTVKSSR